MVRMIKGSYTGTTSPDLTITKDSNTQKTKTTTTKYGRANKQTNKQSNLINSAKTIVTYWKTCCLSQWMSSWGVILATSLNRKWCIGIYSGLNITTSTIGGS